MQISEPYLAGDEPLHSALADYPARLTAVLGGNRDALGLVAAYLSETAGTQPEAYLTRLADAAAAVPSGVTYPPGLYAAFWLSLEQVESEYSETGAVLAYMAAAPIEAMPPDALQFPADVYPPELAGVVTDGDKKARVLDLLHRYTLIDLEPVSGWFSLGAGLREPLIDLLGDQFEAWNQSATAVAEALGLLGTPDQTVDLPELQTRAAEPPRPVTPAELLAAETELTIAAMPPPAIGRPHLADPEPVLDLGIEVSPEPSEAAILSQTHAAKPNIVSRIFGRR